MLIFILLVTIITYSYLWKCGFVIDDYDGIVKFEVRKIDYKNWLLGLLDNLWHKLLGTSARKWHMAVLGYHLITVSLFYLFCNVFFGRQMALIASFLFAIHPCANQTVAWISGRHYSVAGWMVLLSALTYKIPGLFLPIFATTCFMHPQNWAIAPVLAVFGANRLVLGYFLLGLAFIPFYIRLLKVRLKTFQWPGEVTRWKTGRFNMLIKIATYYLAIAVFPFRLGFYHARLFEYDAELDKFNLKTILGVISIGILFAVGIIFKAQLPTLIFGLCWFFAFLLPCMNIIKSNMVFSERYMYIPLMGFCVSLAGILVLILNYQIILAVILTLYFIRTASYSMAYLDTAKLMSVNLRNHPNSVEAHINLGDQYIKLNNPIMAYPLFQRAVELNPNSDVGWFNLGVACVNMGDAIKAREYWEKSLKINPKYVNPRYNLMRLNASVEKQGGWEKLEKDNWKEISSVELVKK